jgi:prepilin-type N-terminal cleavage/methylation domain-containing protein
VSDDRGFTLVEVLVAMTLMVVVLGAVLTTFNRFQDKAKLNEQRNDAQENARRSTARLARELRNAVSNGSPSSQSVERANPFDLVFMTNGQTGASASNPTGLIRMRYCLDATDTANARLWRQTQSFAAAPTGIPANATCPGPAGDGWATTNVVADRITNRRDGVTRALFAYRFDPPASTSLSDLVAISPTLFLDVTPADRAPAELSHGTGVLLRNANQPPVANVAITVSGRRLLLNAQASYDPENQPLRFEWYLNGATTNPLTGARVETQVMPLGTHSVRLVAIDSAGSRTERTQSVVVS